jgi:hypothetical protein
MEDSAEAMILTFNYQALIEFRESLVLFQSDEIKRIFRSAGIACQENAKSRCTGARRRLVERHYATLDFSQHDDLRKLLRALHLTLEALEKAPMTGTGRWEQIAKQAAAKLHRIIQTGGRNHQPVKDKRG